MRVLVLIVHACIGHLYPLAWSQWQCRQGSYYYSTQASYMYTGNLVNRTMHWKLISGASPHFLVLSSHSWPPSSRFWIFKMLSLYGVSTTKDKQCHRSKDRLSFCWILPSDSIRLESCCSSQSDSPIILNVGSGSHVRDSDYNRFQPIGSNWRQRWWWLLRGLWGWKMFIWTHRAIAGRQKCAHKEVPQRALGGWGLNCNALLNISTEPHSILLQC